MSRLLIIGCGGVAQVAIHKCCQNSEVFTEICIASKTKSKCDAIKAELEGKTKTVITTAEIDAMDVAKTVELIKSYKPDAVLNVALPYQDLAIMDACLEANVHYIDTANYEPEDTEEPEWKAAYEKRCKEKGFSALFDYSYQWAYADKYKEAGLTALLGTGFDPGVTSVFAAYAKKHYFDRIENGKWVEIPAMSIKREYNFKEVGQKDMYLLHHEELEALGRNMPEVKRIRFFMTFGQSYLTHMNCLENVGMLSTTPINYEGKEIVPIQFLKALLPDPASLGPRTKGKTNIGCIFTGVKDGKEKSIYIYNICDHEACYKEVGSQAVSYTTGVPAMIGSMLVLNGLWRKPGVYTTDEFDPDPYMEALNKWGLPWQVEENPILVP